jgi:hypothetical protein
MPDLTPEPRGFTGRPLIALFFAVLMGFFVSDILRLWMHLDRLSALAIIIAIVGIVYYAWYWAEKPR